MRVSAPPGSSWLLWLLLAFLASPGFSRWSLEGHVVIRHKFGLVSQEFAHSGVDYSTGVRRSVALAELGVLSVNVLYNAVL